MPCYRAGLECRTGEQPPCARAVLRRMTEMRTCATRTQYPRACCTRRPTAGRYRSPGASAFDRPLNQASPSLSLSLPLHFAHPHIHLFCSFFSVVIFFVSVSLYSPSSPSSPSPPPPFPPPPHPPYPPPLPPPSSRFTSSFLHPFSSPCYPFVQPPGPMPSPIGRTACVFMPVG